MSQSWSSLTMLPCFTQLACPRPKLGTFQQQCCLSLQAVLHLGSIAIGRRPHRTFPRDLKHQQKSRRLASAWLHLSEGQTAACKGRLPSGLGCTIEKTLLQTWVTMNTSSSSAYALLRCSFGNTKPASHILAVSSVLPAKL